MDFEEVMAGRESRPHCTCGTPGHSRTGDDPNEPKWNPDCVIHTIGHYQKPGCCDVTENASGMAPHRAMTHGEYEAEFPEVYNAIFTVEKTRYRLEARRFWDGVGVTITQLFDDSDSGLCFDFSADIVPLLLVHLSALDYKLSQQK